MPPWRTYFELPVPVRYAAVVFFLGLYWFTLTAWCS